MITHEQLSVHPCEQLSVHPCCCLQLPVACSWNLQAAPFGPSARKHGSVRPLCTQSRPGPLNQRSQTLAQTSKRASGYNRTMVSVIIGALFTNGVVPAVPVRPAEAEDYDHVPRVVPPTDILTNAMGLATKALSSKEMLQSPQALEAIQKEGNKVRGRGVWDDDSATDPDGLCQHAKQKGEKLRIADAMTIAGVKNYGMSADKQSYKGRIVYRGDAVRHLLGYPAIFNQLHSLPTNAQAVNLTLFLGLVPG